ncbi:MAG: hypothetical protein Ct9H300mP1_17440 [Planctomycetaceae bacterium]|nr:MAG: hypothetical protein Ct9H300mP1_17440 [Planctomycetaceae bacterium]
MPSHHFRNHGRLPNSGPFLRGLTDIFWEKFPIMAIDLAVVPVAGQGPGCCLQPRATPKGDVAGRGETPSCSTSSRNLPTRALARVLMFITGPGERRRLKIILNKLGIDHVSPGNRPGGVAGGARFRATARWSTSTPGSVDNWAGGTRSCGPAVVGDQPFVVALGDSIIGSSQSNIVARMVDGSRPTGRTWGSRSRKGPREEVVRYGVARPGPRRAGGRV